MHARRIDRAHTGAARAALTANPVLRSMPLWPEVGTPHSHTGASLNAVSAFALSGHEPAIAAAIFDADLKQRLNSEQHRDPARAQLDCAAPVLPGTAFTSSTLRAINARVAVAYSNGLVF